MRPTRTLPGKHTRLSPHIQTHHDLLNLARVFVPVERRVCQAGKVNQGCIPVFSSCFLIGLSSKLMIIVFIVFLQKHSYKKLGSHLLHQWSFLPLNLQILYKKHSIQLHPSKNTQAPYSCIKTLNTATQYTFPFFYLLHKPLALKGFMEAKMDCLLPVIWCRYWPIVVTDKLECEEPHIRLREGDKDEVLDSGSGGGADVEGEGVSFTHQRVVLQVWRPTLPHISHHCYQVVGSIL